MSLYTRLASTDAQEQSVVAVQKAFKKANRNIAGYTTIGKAPQTVILDIKYQGSDVYINSDGRITIGENEFDENQVNEMAEVIQLRANR
jgi:hypothetical protein